MNIRAAPQPFYSCSVERCAEEISLPADMLRWAGDRLICHDCYDETADEHLSKECLLSPPDDDGFGRVCWYDLPEFEDPRDVEIRELKRKLAAQAE